MTCLPCFLSPSGQVIASCLLLPQNARWEERTHTKKKKKKIQIYLFIYLLPKRSIELALALHFIFPAEGFYNGEYWVFHLGFDFFVFFIFKSDPFIIFWLRREIDGRQSHSAAQICCVSKGIQVLLGFRILNQIWFVFPSSNKCDLYKVCDSKMHLNKTHDTIGGFFYCYL